MQYSIAPASTTFPIPESVRFEDAATLPLAVMTSTIGLFKRLALPETPTGRLVIVLSPGIFADV